MLADAASQADREQQVRRLAEKLHVPESGLYALGCVYWSQPKGIDPALRGCWCFPEIDGQGRVIGLLRRSEDGEKKVYGGGKRGVLAPIGWQERAEQTRVVYVVEGPSDVAALWGAGIVAIGRPNNYSTSGTKYAAELLQPLAGLATVVIVGERDEKPDGSWPGRDGALKTAQGLADALGVSVRMVLPPIGVKDSREWFAKKTKPPLDDPAVWAEAGRQLEASWETIELVMPKPVPAGKPRDTTNVPTDDEAKNIAVVCEEMARRRIEEESAVLKMRAAIHAAAELPEPKGASPQVEASKDPEQTRHHSGVRKVVLSRLPGIPQGEGANCDSSLPSSG